MEVRGVGPRGFDQRVVVEKAHAGCAGNLCGHLADSGVEYQISDRTVVLPQIDALHEDLLVVAFASLVVPNVATGRTLADGLVDGLVDRLAPAAEFIGAEQVVDGQVAVLPVGGDLFGGESRMHAVLLGLGVVGVREKNWPATGRLGLFKAGMGDQSKIPSAVSPQPYLLPHLFTNKQISKKGHKRETIRCSPSTAPKLDNLLRRTRQNPWW